MGIYDRDYIRNDEPPGLLSGRSMVVNIIILNGILFVADMLMDGKLAEKMGLYSDLGTHPWNAWQLLTYGFAHANLGHIVFNMISLWFFGPEVEERYGRAEFTRIYLAMMVFAGLIWVVAQQSIYHEYGVVIGASGAIAGIIILNLLPDPQRQLMVFGVARVPAWLLGGLIILSDLIGSFNRECKTAYVAHLGGALFAIMYFYFGWNFGAILPAKLLKKITGPRLRVLRPEEDPRDLNLQVDEILEKISRKGEASLTAAERRTLEEASKRYQRRQKP